MSRRAYGRGTGLDLLVYADNINKTPGLLGAGGGQEAQVSTDKAGINGSTSLDLAGTTYTQHGLIYPGGLNITNTSKDISLFVRVAFKTLAGTQPIIGIGAVGVNDYAVIEIGVDNAGDLKGYFISDAGLVGLNASSVGTTLTTDTWYDIGASWNNATNELKVYVDGALEATLSSTRSFGSLFTYGSVPCINLGHGRGGLNSESYIDEFFVDDSVIDFTSSSFDLTTGTGSLNGASRTLYLAYSATTPYVDPASVSSGPNYIGTGGIAI